jgi:hypothetical protein
MRRQLQHNSGRLSRGVTADYVLQLKGSANDEPKVSTRTARHPERHAVSPGHSVRRRQLTATWSIRVPVLIAM